MATLAALVTMLGGLAPWCSSRVEAITSVNPNFTSIKIIDGFPGATVGNLGPSDIAMRPDGTLLVPNFIGTFDLFAFAGTELAGPFPISAPGHELPCAAGVQYHGLTFGPSGRLFATKPNNELVEVDPVTGCQMLVIGPGTGNDGIAYNPLHFPGKIQTMSGGQILNVDIATGGFTVIANVAADHLAWDPTLRFLIITSGPIGRFDRVTNTFCQGVAIGGADGLSGSNPEFPRSPSQLGLPNQPIFCNATDGTIRVFSATEPPGVSCPSTEQTFASGGDRGDGMSAVGDGSLYVTQSTSIWRFDVLASQPGPLAAQSAELSTAAAPSGSTSDPQHVPYFLEPGSSPQANLYVSLVALKNEALISPQGLANSFVSRMEQVLGLIKRGELSQAKHRLQGLLASIQGLQNNQISAQHKATVEDLIQGVIAGLP